MLHQSSGIIRVRFLCLLLGVFLAAPGFAAELRISESSGLTRLVSDRIGGTSVQITFVPDVDLTEVRLEPVDGLGAPVQVERTAQHIFIAKNVLPGRYTIMVAPQHCKHCKIDTVEVLD